VQSITTWEIFEFEEIASTKVTIRSRATHGCNNPSSKVSNGAHSPLRQLLGVGRRRFSERACRLWIFTSIARRLLPLRVTGSVMPRGGLPLSLIS